MSFGRKNRFISATERTIALLGLNTLQDLIQHAIDVFFVEPSDFRSVKDSLALKKDVIGKGVMLRRITGEEFRAIINVVVVETDSRGIWCEGSIEELYASSSKPGSAFTDLSEFSATFTMEASVSAIMRPPVECSENMPVSTCLSIMKHDNSGSAIITGSEGYPVGILDAGMAGIRLSEERSGETKASEWMITPPIFIKSDSHVSEAFRLIRNSFVNCLIVTGENNIITGMVTVNELTGAFFSSPKLIFSQVEETSSAPGLFKIFRETRRLAVSMILGHADPYSVSLFLASVGDAICSRIIDLCIQTEGIPPCRFAFIQTGSAGRREQTLMTDQDNAIIFEDVSENRMGEISGYFISLGKRINEMLDVAGFRLCTGGNMAGNPEWCQPLSVWKDYFSSWIKMPGPDEILKTSIFFDFRYCYGEADLVEDLRSHVQNNLKTNDIYFHHMALAWKQFNPSASIISSGKTNIKKLLMPVTGIIRLYALKYGISGHSTLERISGLYSGSHLDLRMLRETLKAWRDLSAIRFSHQTSFSIKETEPDNIIDFNLSDYDSRSFALQAISAINNLMLKAGTDFYTEII